MRVDDDQLPRACRDYYTAQGWVDVSTADCGVTVACPDAPMVQIGAFAFGANRETVDLERALVLGWVTNNYWETNFRAHQPGAVSARYRLLPHAGPFDEQDAHRFGAEAAAPPLFQPLWEPSVAQTTLPRAGSLLRLPDPPVLTLHVLPDGAALCLRLLNASDAPATATVGSGLLQIVGAARSDLLGSSAEELATDRGAVTVAMAPREMVALRLSLGGEPGRD
jgi:alpha-mannosidase